ncbi:hypothetical protein MTF65_04150 [Streptomyces sp. APSN-46.1]|uniref:hypothetical protein n=1 Tax=Streptomyces sp. APSN-46.1 TaxID=2929049 RepID=UPI001FB35616|nr:hypothetical protein [Streptomyces sp. APSN-46.1]MCJ1676553.1 hypothetical protein [Streptomyces sp. APSN-46.1]
MRRIPALASTVAPSPPRRPRLALAVTALAVLALAACGTEKTNAGGEQTKPAGAVGGQPDPAFTAMLDDVARSCPPSAPPEPMPTGPVMPLPTGVVEIPTGVEPIAPTAGPEVELNARDRCASNLHEERIAQALWDVVDPTPTKVRAILNDLGYVDERIHDLKQSGATTRFFLDLRDKGGRLCLEGSAAGEETVVDKCVAPTSGPFTPGERKE